MTGVPAGSNTGSGPAPPKSGAWALGTLASITAVVLVLMLLVLNQGTSDAGGRARRDNASASGSAGSTQPTGTAVAPSTVPRPGLRKPVADLDETVEWTAPIAVANVTCAGPTRVGDTIAVMCDNRHLYGFDRLSGDQQFDTTIDQDAPTFTNAPTAAVGHLALYARTNEVVAVDIPSGVIAWRAPRDFVILGVAGTDTAIAIVGGGHVEALDPATGQPRWQAPVDPALRGQQVRLDLGPTDVVTSLGAGLQAFDITSGQSHWTAPLTTSDVTAIHAAADGVYAIDDHGTVVGLDAGTGAVRWTRNGHFEGTQQNIAGGDADRVYVVSTNELGALGTRDGAIAWSFTAQDAVQQRDGLDRASWSEDHLLTRGAGDVWLVTPASGAATASRHMNSASPGLVHDGHLYILEATGNSRAPWRLQSIALP